MLKKVKFIVGCWILGSTQVFAQEPTTVYSAAARPDGGENVFVVSQPNNLENPLGNPIVGPETPPKVFGSLPKENPVVEQKDKQQALPVGTLNETPEQESLALGKDFQNTLVEGNGRLYDIQSYPLKDVDVMSDSATPQTIYSPNVVAP